MKAVDLTEDTLEDLLSYDDQFLDYFNAFLQLPAFSESLEYDRLIGSFQEVNRTENGSSTLGLNIPQSAGTRSNLGSRGAKRYGVSDDERESLLEWCKNNRLPYFLETELFRELKLLKLLLRTLEDRFQSSASHKSSQIRGYSRQTESYVSSLSNSADNSANEEDYGEEWSGESSDRYNALPAGCSRAASLPAQLDNPYYSRGARSKARRKASRNDTQTQHAKKVIFAQRRELSAGGIDSVNENSHFTGVTRQTTFMSVDVDDEDMIRKRPSADFIMAGEGRIPIRALSAPINYKEFLNIPIYPDFNDIFLNDSVEDGLQAEKFISYNEDKASEQQTESDMKHLEGKINMSLQQMKERIFSSRAGMEEFKSFLSDTNGIHLLNFWLDCENFKDAMADHDEVMKLASRNQLFRDIQDKYKMSLTPDACAQIQKAASSYQLSHTVFIRTQYDVLRRLRTYWIPRFILHREKANKLQTLLGMHQLNVASTPEKLDKFSDSFLPKISLAHSLPLDHNKILQMTSKGDNWIAVISSGGTLDKRVKSGIMRPINPQASVELRDRMVHALQCDRRAGGPFKAYLSKFEKTENLAKLMFWEAVADYNCAEDRSADRLLRLNQAWTIYNTYLTASSPHCIGLAGRQRSALHDVLRECGDFVKVEVFDDACNYSLNSLVQPWSLYVKHDVKLYLDAQAARFGVDARPQFSLDSISLHCEREDPRVVVHKPLVRLREPSASSVSTVKVKRTPLSKSARIRRREMLAEQRIQLRKEQKALLKAVKARQEETKQQRIVDEAAAKANKKDLNSKGPMSTEVVLGPDGEPIEPDEYGETVYSRSGKSRKSAVSQGNSSYKDEKKSAKIAALMLDKDVEFLDMVANRPMMVLFKRYLIENEAKDYINAVNLYNEIDVYYKTDPKPKTKKDLQANFIYKSFMETGAKKMVKLTEKVYTRLATEKERPKTATLKEAQSASVAFINPMFHQFFEAQAEEFGVETRVLATMSQNELTMRAEADAGGGPKKKVGGGKNNKKDGSDATGVNLIGSSSVADLTQTAKPRRKKQSKRKITGVFYLGYQMKGGSQLPPVQVDSCTGKAPPSKEDKLTLMNALQQCQMSGKPTVQVDYFWKYLIKHGDEDNNPLIDKDLTFYLEVQKYKDLSHVYTDEEIVKKKCQAITDCYLESSIAPPCQIDISSDMCTRIVKNAVKVMQGKETIPNLFDEALFVIFKEILPYWAGFMKTYQPPEDVTKLPLSKHQKALQKRYEEFKNSVPPKEHRIVLPAIRHTGPQQAMKISSFTYSITEGFKMKTEADEHPDLDPKLKGQGKPIVPRRKASILSVVESVASVTQEVS